jgi:molybdopterin molybdotransferase
LAQAVAAPWDIPRFKQSAMDGFAYAHASAEIFPTELGVSAHVFAGEVPAPLLAGTVVRIMTGAALPSGADTVVAFEDAQATGDRVRFTPGAKGTHVRHPGEDVTAGEIVVAAGTRLTARHLGAIAALGYAHLDVVRRPTVAIITTGDELLAAGESPDQAHIIDSNGPYLSAALTRMGAQVVSCRHCADETDAFEQAMEHASAADLVIVTGGASMGDRDVAREVLSTRGVDFVAVRMQPGKPQGAGLWQGSTPALSLPGNPVSVVVSCAVFVRPLVDAMLGVTPAQSKWAKVGSGWRSVAGRRQFYPVKVESNRSGDLVVVPATAGGAGSHLVTSLVQADALAVIPEEMSMVTEGDCVELLAIP